MYSSSAISTCASRNRHAASSRRTPVGSPPASRSTTPPGVSRSPFARASAAELSQSECESRASRAAGTSPVTASRSSRVGSAPQSAPRQPRPRSQPPGGTLPSPARTSASASSSEGMSSRRTSLRATAHVGKCTCASLKPGTTQRPPRSTRSGLASARSCTPTPPAISSPAIASARATGSAGSRVRIVPFSRITRPRTRPRRRRRRAGPRPDRPDTRGAHASRRARTAA